MQWGTGASAEVNVRIAVSEETKHWADIHSRIEDSGVSGIIETVNRRKQQWVDDPEIRDQ